MTIPVLGLPVLLLAISCAPSLSREGDFPASKSLPELKGNHQLPSGKFLTGALAFQGLEEGELNQFRVIPEEGGGAFTPRNQRYPEVDGFWWRPDRGRWFKIPDHGEAWIGKPNQQPPFISDGSEQLGNAQVYWRSNPALRWVSGLRGAAEPGFYPNAGRTRIGVPYPF